MASPKQGNPAVVGLAAFGLTTLVLQEMKTGNNFGYSAFTAYGAFWISLALLLIGNQTGLFVTGTAGTGWFLVAWTLYTAIMWVGAMRINSALAWTFTTLLIGFILLDLAHFGFPAMTVVAGYELMVCALPAWYVMAHLIFADVFGRDVLPVGKPWIRDRAAEKVEAPVAAIQPETA